MYNSPKKLYVIKNDSNEYLQEISTNWGYFCTARLFSSAESAKSCKVAFLSETNCEILEFELTKWMFDKI